MEAAFGARNTLDRHPSIHPFPTMSFQDVSNPQRTARLTRQHQLDRRSRSERLARTSPERTIRIRPTSLHNHPGSSSKHNKPKITKKSDHYMGPSLLSKATISSTFSSHEEETDALHSIRNRTMQRSEFSQLVKDIRHFQALVKDLEISMQTQETSTSPEAAWRTRILWTSAVETDSAVTQRLITYERSLRIVPIDTKSIDDENKQELRTAQSACLKLHRDVQRTHRSLQSLLTKYHQTQQFDIQARLGSVGWSSHQVEPIQELKQMNESMHQVNDMMQHLAGLVHTQQEPIDQLEKLTQQAHDTVESGYRQVSCATAMENPREMLVCGAPTTDSSPKDTARYKSQPQDGMNLSACGVRQGIIPAPRHHQGFDRTISLHDEDEESSSSSPGCDWRLQWENVRNGVLGLRHDLVMAGRDLRQMAAGTTMNPTEQP